MRTLLSIISVLYICLCVSPVISKVSAASPDFNDDGSVNHDDFLLFQSNYRNPYTLADYNQLIIYYTRPVAANPPVSGVSGGMWISKSEIMALPTTGTAWTNMRNAAYSSWGTADLKNQDNRHPIDTLAGAFVYARTDDSTLREKVRDAILAAKRSLDETSEYEDNFTALAVVRQVGAYAIAADTINLKIFDPSADQEFRSWLGAIRTRNVGTHSRWKNITHICENSANNWGTFACPSRIAASLYLGDDADVERAAHIIRAFMGERHYYPSDAPGQNGYFQHTALGETSGWYCDESAWTAINSSCVKRGVNIDGVLGEDAARGGDCCTLQGDGNMYSWEVLQGIFVSAELLYRTGKFGNPYMWSNQALKRTMDFMVRSGWNITNPSPYVSWMANKRYGASYPTAVSTKGRIMSWGDWLYSN